jgi:hypothetical protein
MARTKRGTPPSYRRHSSGQACVTVSEVARRLGVRPRDISDLFYQLRLDDAACPIVGGRRLIPIEYVPVIQAALQSTHDAPDGQQ